ncbi:helix-turn-helix domain-containing protein [Lederbergia citri]|uniref:Helix-turn-helix transcriptional regulator n=1 Tax=Lederbergia citri TaxID=2833580 RepID=A0A942T8Y8_9BACI|nr:helix-turn-helix transcriptional regulator [Lederbergia citri]MBS4193481.1 helix-turn-helix transcriptional regulator [Lederbergia citri]
MNSELFRFIRVSRRLTQREYAKMLVVSHGLVAQIEAGFKPLTSRTAEKVRLAFDLTDEELAEIKRVLKVVYTKAD